MITKLFSHGYQTGVSEVKDSMIHFQKILIHNLYYIADYKNYINRNL